MFCNINYTEKNGCSNMGQPSYMFNCSIYRCLTVISKILIFAYFKILDITAEYLDITT